MIRVVILDMYGVIMKHPEGALMPYMHSNFPTLTESEVYAQWREGNIGKLSSLDFFRNLGFPGDPAVWEQDYLDSLEIDEGFLEVAPKLKERYRLGLITNDFAEWSDYLRAKFGMDELFDAVVVSGAIGMKKPEPEVYRLLLQQLGANPAECLFVDDRKENLDAAAALGMQVVLYNSRGIVFSGRIVYSFIELLNMLNFLV